MKKLSLSLLFVFIYFSSFGQNTLKLGDNKSPKATLADIAWLSGHWRGEAFGGITEEIWSPPLGDSMMGSFKLVSEGKNQFLRNLPVGRRKR